MPNSIWRQDIRDKKKWKAPTGAMHTYQLSKPTVHVLELEDIHFHHDSAVLLPDQRVGGAPPSGDPGENQWGSLAAVAACLRYAKNEPTKKLLIVGHTDTSGDAAYNLPLSRLRAKAVHAVVKGLRDDWIDVCMEKSKVEDYQEILGWVARTWDWPCDPGGVDNVNGPKTKAAVKGFQDQYGNHWDDDSKKGGSIAVDGVVGRDTWGAIFDVYGDALEQMLHEETEAKLDEYRGALHWLDDGTPRVGCGEKWPIEAPELSNYKSETNRRVELLFFGPDHEPETPLRCHPSETKCDSAKCQIYWKYHRIYLPVDPFMGAETANVVRITALPRWFIPGVETCDVGYALEGPQSRADKLMLEVHASNYCELDDWNGGLPKWKALADTPVYTRELKDDFVKELAEKTVADWKGETNCAKGILAKGADGKDRVLDVACSPYTVHFRYSMDEGDKDARIELSPFWPAFDSAEAPVAASLTVKYKVRDTGNKLTAGTLEVWDLADKVVFTKDLGGGDLTDAEHSFDWDGTTTDGAKIVKDSMPYRVQVRGHAKRGAAKGLALAAMHTEIRLYVHPGTVAADLDPYVALDDKSSLSLGLADLYHKDAEPTRGADGTAWTKFALATGGFHPGPVNDGSSNAHYTTALGEFQRSVPKHPPGPPFVRLALSGSDDADTKDALENLPAARKRPWFGNAADRKDLDPAGAVFPKDFRDPTKTLIVWVDDRHWYTDPNWLNPPDDDVTPTIRSLVRAHPTAVGDMRNRYTWRDDRVARDEIDIARPSIPVQTEFRLLKKTQKLADILTDTPAADVVAATREAIGPLRVDWSFDEVDGDAIKVPEVDRTQYHKERTRTRAALEWALDDLKTADYVRKDVKRKSTYFNCPANNSGIRPADGAGYYKAPFGLDAECLLPWKTADATDRETVLTVVHDRLGQGADDICPARRLGRAGAYFHPSRMGGDGYRLRAQVWFATHADYAFANVTVLADRYARAPQAHSAALRLWRKTSMRGYLQWGAPAAHWPATRGGMLTQHNACHMHMVNEIGVTDGEVAVPLNDFWGPSDLAAFRNVVKSCINGPTDVRRQNANIDLTATSIWPWHAHANLGVLNPVGPNPANPWNDVFAGIAAQVSSLWYKLTNRMAIEIADVLEKKKGRMRGHVVVEFLTTPDFWSREYRCNTCNRRYHYCTKDGTTITHQNAACPFGGCAGHLLATATAPQHYTQQLPVPSIGDPIGVSYNFDGTARLWTHELSHNRYYEHCANAPGAFDAHHDHVNNPDPTVSADTFTRPAPPDDDGTNAARQWDRACTMTYVTHLTSYDAVKDVAFFCFRCVLKNRGWKLAGVNDAPAATAEP